MSKVVHETFFGATKEMLGGLFGSFDQPCLRSQIRRTRDIRSKRLSGFGWGVIN